MGGWGSGPQERSTREKVSAFLRLDVWIKRNRRRRDAPALLTQRTGYGQRVFWECPNPSCRQRCRFVYWTATGWRCRLCAADEPLLYRSQFQRPDDRALMRLVSFCSRHFGINVFETATLPRPPRMRWKTYRRLAARAQELDREAGTAFEKRSARLLDELKRAGL